MSAILEARQLCKRYGGTVALDHIDLALEPGRIVGLLGPNGSGKTTFIKLCTGFLKPQEGEVRIDGHNPGAHTKSIVSYLPDREFLPEWMKVSELLRFYQDFYEDFQIDRARAMLESLSLEEAMSLRKMSKGTKEKIRLILTMSRNALVYLLDEPIAGVDPAARDYILRTILQNYDSQAMVLISTHLIQDVESILDEVVFLKKGQIVLHKNADSLREETGMSVDKYFREVFRC